MSETTQPYTVKVIALWENAEDQAVLSALKPLNRGMGEARFEINT